MLSLRDIGISKKIEAIRLWFLDISSHWERNLDFAYRYAERTYLHVSCSERMNLAGKIWYINNEAGGILGSAVKTKYNTIAAIMCVASFDYTS